MSAIDLFADQARQITIANGAYFLHGFGCSQDVQLISAVQNIILQAPFRHMETSGGYRMSVAMTNCGKLGWITDRKGYRYSSTDPQTGQYWPKMPDCLMALAQQAATKMGYADFKPDVCLINRYEVGSRMALHQDKDEQDAAAPVVSLSLGVAATFLFGGLQRSDRPQRILLSHGDVVVWGGESRFNFHGVAPLKAAHHSVLGHQRINLTFRKVL